METIRQANISFNDKQIEDEYDLDEDLLNEGWTANEFIY